MVFSSSVFLFIFLPIIIIVYYLPFFKNRKIRNFVLLLFSLGFYWYGEPKFVFVMIISIIINWIIGLLIDKYNKHKKIFVILSCIYNVGLLFIFKYLGFVSENISKLINNNITIKIILPIGISFFTFQMMSYVFDVAKGNVKCQKNLINLALYVSMFPQLIAGPIVRYETVENEIVNRKENWNDFSEGMCRFIKGLAKKIFIANNIAVLADFIFNSDLTKISAATAWLGAIAYTLQIYYDFSGYSDMAIGLGRIFGFHFDENFNYPYIAKTISDFWRRWHISMGTWFKDYIYIPLGGNRLNKLKNIRNLFIVWLLTGIWHGANWNFIVWGLMYFVLIVIEKLINLKNKKIKIGHLYTMFFVIIGWVLFRTESLNQCFTYLKVMFDYKNLIDIYAINLLKQFSIFIVLGIVFAFPIIPTIKKYINKNKKLELILYTISIILLYLLDIIYVVKSGYNPFIYFNF